MTVKNALIINAHQRYAGISEGKLNASLVEVLKTEIALLGGETKTTRIEDGYDVDEEVQKHLWADFIVTQGPVYWFGFPWIYKKYADEVFNAGLMGERLLVDDGRTRSNPNKQYGTGGKMQGKKYMLSLTWNAPREAFDNPEQVLFSGKSVDDLFVSNTAIYKFCGAQILPSFSCFDVMKAPRISEDMERLKAHLREVLK